MIEDKEWHPKSGTLAVYKANGDYFYYSEIVEIRKWYVSKSMIDFVKISKYREKDKRKSIIVRKCYLKEHKKEN